MRFLLRFSPIVLLFLLASFIHAQSLHELDAKRVVLPNGWGITPVGKSLPLGDLPLNMAISPNHKLIAITNNGQSIQSLQLIDAAKQKVLDTKEVDVAWLGMAWSDNSEQLYCSGGNGNFIQVFQIKRGRLVPTDTIFLGKPWPERISVAGIALDDTRHLLYAVTKENNSLYVIDAAAKKILKQLPLGAEGYTCLLSPDKKTLYISCWGCQKVILFNTEKQEFNGSIAVGSHPNDMALNKAGDRLFVANADDNSVSVIDLQKGYVTETLNAALYPNAPSGSTTNGIALSEDDKTLYVANADNNCLAVFDVSVPGRAAAKASSRLAGILLVSGSLVTIFS